MLWGLMKLQILLNTPSLFLFYSLCLFLLFFLWFSMGIENQKVGWDFFTRLVALMIKITGTWRHWITFTYLLFLLASCLEEVSPFWQDCPDSSWR